MLECCNKRFTPSHTFYAENPDYISVKIEFDFCPHCKKPNYKEIRTSFHSSITTHLKRGREAEKAFKTAFFNRLLFLNNVKNGSKTAQGWYYGACKKTNRKDYKGNPIELQIKKNFNNEIVEILGAAPVVYG